MSQQAQKQEWGPWPIHPGLQEFVIIAVKNKFQKLRNPTAWALKLRPEMHILQSCTCTPELPLWIIGHERAQNKDLVLVPISQMRQNEALEAKVSRSESYNLDIGLLSSARSQLSCLRPLQCGDYWGPGERGRFVLPEREERKALEWSPLKESEEWPGREGEEHTTQGKQHMHSGWKKHRMMG